MKKNRTKRQQAIIRRRIFLSLCALVLVGVITLLSFVAVSIFSSDRTSSGSPSSDNSDIVSSEEKPKESFATVMSTGDIMVHSTQLTGAYNSQTGEYDFSCYFKEVAPLFKQADLAVANLEVTFGGTESGKFSGYPAFNTPDSLADALKNDGINFLLTANNHSYDTGMFGLQRTAQVLKQKGFDFIGTRETAEENLYTVKEINDIKIGMANYTYSSISNGRKNLNGNQMKAEAESLISTFVFDNAALENFYMEADTIIADMKNQGAEFIVFYMHWGNEYKLTPNTWQKTIAQKLANLGVDIIIGSHPHVVQPVELIHSEDGQNTTVCLYSTGNAVSNQRQELMDSCPSGHTEDGLIFSYTLRKYGNDVTLDSIGIIPTWVNKYKGGGGHLYTVYPLTTREDATKYGLDATAVAKAQKSFDRTKAIVAEGLSECQNNIGCKLTFVE